MLRALMEKNGQLVKTDGQCKQEYWKKLLEIKNLVTKMENDFGSPVDWWPVVSERISNLEDMSVETSETKMQRENRIKKME